MLSSKLFFEDSLHSGIGDSVQILKSKIKDEQGAIGYYSLPDDSNETLNKIYKFIFSNNAVYKGKINNLVIMGIGGSSLGTKAVDCALKHTKNRNEINLIFLENCDPKDRKSVV